MTWIIPFVVAWAVWLLVDRRFPPVRALELLGAPDDRSRGAGDRARPARPPVPPGARKDDQLPDLAASVDLLAVAVSAGYSLHGAVRVAGAEGHGPVARALAVVAADFDRGLALADGLAALPRRLGPGAATLATTLSVAAVSGTPLGPALQRLADGERRRSRRAAEARARRLPVLLLGPLVGLVLPAFVVLTIVPAALSSAAGRPVPVAPLPPSVGPAAVVPGP